MADYDMPAAVKETAKAVQSISETSRSLGGYLAAVLGETPFTTMAIVDDRLKLFRAEKVMQYYERAARRLKDAGLDPSQLRLPSPSIELPLLEAATLEDRGALEALWANLLAAAMHPDRRNRVRARHIEILRRLEPIDARLLRDFTSLIEENDRVEQQRLQNQDQDRVDFVGTDELLTRHFKIDIDELQTSIANLTELRLIRENRLTGIIITGEGRNFLSVVENLT